MKRYGDLWPQFRSWENLVEAARKARRGKRDRPIVQQFEFRRETELLQLQRELDADEWRPGPFTTHWIHKPKPRLISAAPYRDRVVHHALMNVLEPILDRHFHPDNYACRQGKGTHAASRRLQTLLGRNRYFVHADIVKFFPSIDHEMLKCLFRRRIKDRRVLAIMDAIVDGSNPQEPVSAWFPGDELFTPSERRKGLPIGNLTSQWFANWFLDDLDHAVTCQWRVGGYVRYCDDFVLLDDDPGRLFGILDRCNEWAQFRRLQLHRQRRAIEPRRAGVTFVGYRTWATHRLLPAANVRQFVRRWRWIQREYARRRINSNDVMPRLMSWLGHVGLAQTRGLIRRLSRSWLLRRMHRSES